MIALADELNNVVVRRCVSAGIMVDEIAAASCDMLVQYLAQLPMVEQMTQIEMIAERLIAGVRAENLSEDLIFAN